MAAHIAAFVLLRDELLRERSVGETPEFISIFVPLRTQGKPSPAHPRQHGAQRVPRAALTERARATKIPPQEIPKNIAPQPSRAAPSIDWLGEAEKAVQDQLESQADRKRSAQWLSRGANPETHPLVFALKPLSGKRPEFGWSHEHTHRVEHVPGGPLLFWINRRCVIAFVGVAIIPACAVGHIEPNGALFEHMDDDLGLAAGAP